MLEAKRALLPAIALSGNAGTSSEQIDEILNKDFSIWSLAGNAAQPILAGGSLRQRVSMRRGEVKQAVADFEKTALNAFGEVENALESEAFRPGGRKPSVWRPNTPGRPISRLRKSSRTAPAIS